MTFSLFCVSSVSRACDLLGDGGGSPCDLFYVFCAFHENHDVIRSSRRLLCRWRDGWFARGLDGEIRGGSRDVRGENYGVRIDDARIDVRLDGALPDDSLQGNVQPAFLRDELRLWALRSKVLRLR